MGEDEAEEIMEEEAIVLYQDKKYYPDIEEVYPGVETVIEEEDSMAISDPLIKDIVVKKFDIVEKKAPKSVFEHSFMLDLMKIPELIRNVAVVGHLHHGKTQIMDVIVEQAIGNAFDKKRQHKFTDARKDE